MDRHHLHKVWALRPLTWRGLGTFLFGWFEQTRKRSCSQCSCSSLRSEMTTWDEAEVVEGGAFRVGAGMGSALPGGITAGRRGEWELSLCFGVIAASVWWAGRAEVLDHPEVTVWAAVLGQSASPCCLSYFINHCSVWRKVVFMLSYSQANLEWWKMWRSLLEGRSADRDANQLSQHFPCEPTRLLFFERLPGWEVWTEGRHHPQTCSVIDTHHWEKQIIAAENQAIVSRNTA